MRILLYLALTMCLLNCTNSDRKGEQTSEPKTEQLQPVTEIKAIDSSFDSFLIEFSANEEFQLTRVKFPFNITLLDILENEEQLTISIDQWQHTNLLDTVNIKTRELDAYSQTTERSESQTIIKLRGIDNGIRVDYKFQLVEGQWFLTDIFNASS